VLVIEDIFLKQLLTESIMAAGNWLIYANAIKRMLAGEVDLDSDTFKIALVTSSYTPSLTADDQWADISSYEVAGLYGYTTGGQALANISLTLAGSTVTWDNTVDPTWEASGGDLIARYAVIYDDTDANKTPVCYCLLDNTPADITVTDGNSLIIQFNANGIFQAN